MKILLLGKNGQVGFELNRALQSLGQVLALSRHTDNQGYCGDVTNFDAISHVINQYQPDIIVNATAYTAVDKAESDKQTAELINHLAVAHLAEYAKTNNSLLIHYSTDYIFDGTGDTPWSEYDISNPINYYGVSKRQGEIALENSHCQFINIRTSWVYGAYGQNFLKTMLKLGKEKDTLNIINDQIGSPTPAFLIADITASIIQKYQSYTDDKRHHATGHYHLAPTGFCSWYEYANHLFNIARQLEFELNIQTINPISTNDYPTIAKRPLNSRLNTDKLTTTFNLSLPHWQFGIDHVLKTIKGQS